MIKKVLFIFTMLISFHSAILANGTDSVQVEENQSFVAMIEHWYADNMNYFSITALMAAESSILPVPSEMVIPPAVYVAMNPGSNLSILWIIVFGTLGALIGATINYLILGMLLGRPLLYRFANSKTGHFLMLSGEKLQKAEDYFNQHGKISTFVGRFIPVVRHLISIPAGFARMNFAAFALFTFLGAGLWNCCLALLGYIAHGQQDLINKYSHELGYGVLAIAVLLIIWLVVKSVGKKSK